MGNTLEEHYTVTTFSSPSLGPLTKRQTNNREHFIRTMEFLGLADVDIDSLTSRQRGEIAALAAQRRRELDAPNKAERGSALNKRQWDLRRGKNIRLYKALDALGLVIPDVELLTQEQRTVIYAELKRQEKVRNTSDSSIVNLIPSSEYEELGRIYTTKPQPFVDVSSLRELVVTSQTYIPTKPNAIRRPRKQQIIGELPESQTISEAKPKAKEKQKPTALCPKPYKRTYATKEIAQTFIEKEFPNDKKIAPYLCSCGAIHIGH